MCEMTPRISFIISVSGLSVDDTDGSLGVVLIVAGCVGPLYVACVGLGCFLFLGFFVFGFLVLGLCVVMGFRVTGM